MSYTIGLILLTAEMALLAVVLGLVGYAVNKLITSVLDSRREQTMREKAMTAAARAASRNTRKAPF